MSRIRGKLSFDTINAKVELKVMKSGGLQNPPCPSVLRFLACPSQGERIFPFYHFQCQHESSSQSSIPRYNLDPNFSYSLICVYLTKNVLLIFGHVSFLLFLSVPPPPSDFVMSLFLLCFWSICFFLCFC